MISAGPLRLRHLTQHRMRIIPPLCLAAATLLAACTNAPKPATPEPVHAAHWSYEGETSPIHWAQLEQGAQCGGSQQSPINILDAEAVATSSDTTLLRISYAEQTHIQALLNNGHTLEYDFADGDSVYFRGTGYALKQFHFHEPSEHTLNGVRYPIEMHLVHKSAQGGILVLSVLGKEGKGSAPFAFLESWLPVKQGETKPVNTPFSLLSALPEDHHSYYHYTGSLTTPPCTEGVHWFVFQTPMEVSEAQVKAIGQLMPVDNYRTQQPLNDRKVVKYFGSAKRR